MGKNDSIDYDNLTYGDIFSAIKKLGINMCNDEKLLKYHLQNKKNAKYEMGNFCEQYGLPPIAPSRQKGKKHDSDTIKITNLWYQSRSFLAGDSVVVFSFSPSVSTQNFGAQLLCPLLTIVGATLVVK